MSILFAERYPVLIHSVVINVGQWLCKLQQPVNVVV